MSQINQSILELLVGQHEVVQQAIVDGSDIPFMSEFMKYGPYAIIGVLFLVVKTLYKELKEEKSARLFDRDRFDKEKQELNDRILNVSRETTTAVIQSTKVQQQLLEAVKDMNVEVTSLD